MTTSDINTLTVTSPFDGDVIAELEKGDARFVEQALATAHALFRDRESWLPIRERIGILNRTAGLLTKESGDFARLIAREGGKPLQDAEVEVARAIDGIRIAVDLLREQSGHMVPLGTNESTTNRISFTISEPIGLVVAVSAFNHPLNLIVHQIIPAIAAGCPVIVKPSEDTPLCCLKLVALLHRAGLAETWCTTLITDEIPVAQALVTDPRVAFFSFIGSARIGWMLKAKLAPGTRCALEHGGAAPLIVSADADMEAAMAAILKGGFYHAGQVCVSVQRVYLPTSCARDFATQLARGAAQLKVGDPLNADTDVGPLIRKRELQRVTEWVTEAIDQGAECLTGGAPLSASCYPPTVLLNPPQTARISNEEVFGPVVCVYTYENIGDAIFQANRLDVAFQAAVFTANIDKALEIASQLDASAVMINDHTAFRTDAMPFAGLRQSGLGVGGIPYTLEDMQIKKLIVIKSKHI